LPSIPAVAVLFSATLVKSVDEERRGNWPIAAVGATWVFLAALPLGRWLNRLPPETRGSLLNHLLPWLAVAAAGGVFIAALALARRPWAGVVVSCLLFAGLTEVGSLRFLPQLDAALSARAAAEVLASSAKVHQNLLAFEVPRDWRYGLDFYLGREIQEWTPQVTGPVWVCTTPAGVDDLVRSGEIIRFLEKMSPEILLVRVDRTKS
jgi:hypothetical protein